MTTPPEPADAESLVLVEDAGTVRRLVLNRPSKLNAMSGAMVERLSRCLADAAADDAVRVVVIAGSGRAFCAGYDLDDPDDTHTLAGYLARLLEVFDMPQPVIAEVHGYCLAGGCDLMMMCDLAVAADDAVFGQPEIRFGSAVVAMVLPWLIGARRAKEMVLTGRGDITAAEAERIGLVNRVVPGDELRSATMDLAGQLATVDAVTMRLAKRALNRAWEAAGFRRSLAEAVQIGERIEADHAPERDEFERIRRSEGLQAAIAWRDARFESGHSEGGR